MHPDPTVRRLLEALYAREDRRQAKRVKQQEEGLALVGPSSCDSCERQVVYRMLRTEEVNQPDRLAAVMGTAVHAEVDKALSEMDPFDEDHLSERRVAAIPDAGVASGTFDLLYVNEGHLVDIKTITKKNARYFPKQGQVEQLMVYAHQLLAEGYNIVTVEVVGICRDGHEDDIKVWSSVYSEDMAKDAIERIRDLRKKALAVRDGDHSAMPPPGRPARTFCARYCEFYDPKNLCPGK